MLVRKHLLPLQWLLLGVAKVQQLLDYWGHTLTGLDG